MPFAGNGPLIDCNIVKARWVIDTIVGNRTCNRAGGIGYYVISAALGLNIDAIDRITVDIGNVAQKAGQPIVGVAVPAGGFILK